MHSQANIR